jgi:hydrogenase-4 membrane subunit HyfE
VSGQKTARIVFTALFVVFGLLCVVMAISALSDLIPLVRDDNPTSRLLLWTAGIPVLLGLCIVFCSLLWRMISAWMSDR